MGAQFKMPKLAYLLEYTRLSTTEYIISSKRGGRGTYGVLLTTNGLGSTIVTCGSEN